MDRKVLVRCPNWLGDIIMAVPAINALKKVFPGERLYGYVRTEYADILKRVEGIDEILPFTKKNLLSELGMVNVLKRTGFSRAVILPNSWTSALIPFIAAVPQRYGYNVRSRSAVINRSFPVRTAIREKHQVHYYLDLVRQIQDLDFEEAPVLNVPADDCAALVTKYSLAGKKLCAFMPAAAYGEAKCWFRERYAELGRRLAVRGFTVLIFGGKADRQRCEEIGADIGESACNLSGKSGIAELPVLLKLCNFAVANDSGPMHVSAAVNTPVVSIFGSTNPDTTYPFGFRDLVIHHELECSRCLDRDCRKKNDRMLCMELITVDEVMAKLESRGLV